MAAGQYKGWAAIISRIAAAVIGGFAATSTLIIALPMLLPGSKVQWVAGLSMLGFALWTGAAVWVFAARTATWAWGGLAIVTALGVAAIWITGAVPA